MPFSPNEYFSLPQFAPCLDGLYTLAPLAVVPVFVNAGAAIIPAIVAPVASALALLFKPKELVRAVRRRPWVPLLILAIGAGAWVGIVYLNNSAQAARPAVVSRAGDASAGPRVDWAQVALELIRQEKAGPPATRPVATAPTTAAAPATGRVRPFVFRGDYTRRGYDGGPVPLDLKPSWTFHSPDDAMMLSSPAVVGDRVFCTTAFVDFSGHLGSLFCRNATTGNGTWLVDSVEIDGKKQNLKPFISSPAVTADGKFVVIGQGLHDDRDSSLVCFEADTGKLRWEVKTPLHIESSPAIFGDLAVAGAGAVEEGPEHKAKGDPGFVLAVNISTGKQMWKQKVEDPESSPAISEDGIVYIGSGFNGNAVFALRSESDEELQAKNLPRVLWRTETPYPAAGDVTLAGDLVLLGCGNSDFVVAAPEPAGAIFAFDRKDGSVRWKVTLPDSVLGAIAAQGDRLYAPCRNGEMLCLNAADGKIIWRQAVNGTAPLLAGPAVAKEIIYAVSNDGILAVMDAKDGHVLERQKLNDDDKPPANRLSVSSPTIAGGKVYVGSETGGLHCFTGGKFAE